MSLTCGKCDNGWICEEHPDLPWPHDDCGGPDVPCENPACDFSIIATGCGWACRPAKENENLGIGQNAAGSGESEISHGASEAEQLIDPERA